jgi:hypothetical protein
MKNILTIFCEADGNFSMRRVLAFVLTVAGIVLLFTQASWQPGAVSIGAALLLLFFTTWGDVAAVIKAAKGAQ